MKLKVYDNPETQCRELWINDVIYIAVCTYDLDPSYTPEGDSILAKVIQVGEWESGRAHIDTERSNELV